ncbi:MAG TPA: 3-deoxy-D-manno-octulosonic acid transferase, partial [Opitutaceae bacterium]
RRGAARAVADPADLAAQAPALLQDAAARSALSGAAEAWRRDNGGGVERTLAVIRQELAGAG